MNANEPFFAASGDHTLLMLNDMHVVQKSQTVHLIIYICTHMFCFTYIYIIHRYS